MVEEASFSTINKNQTPWKSFSSRSILTLFLYNLSNLFASCSYQTVKVPVPSLPQKRGHETGSKHVELWNVPQIKNKKEVLGEHKRQADKDIMKQWATTWLLNDWALKVHLRISLWSRKACLLQTRHSGPLGRRVNYPSTKIYACGRYRAEAQFI